MLFARFCVCLWFMQSTSFLAPDWLKAFSGRVLLDVRSPAEYAQGHIPGALSFPLFSNEERAAVGTAYKQEGPEPAFLLGLDFVGPKMAGFVRSAQALAPERRIAMYCWRGGQRSGSMAWLLRQGGFDVLTLQGGYKAWRNVALEQLHSRQFIFKVLGGLTGSGKTPVLHALAALGEQAIDLEGLAHHKGSAFGQVGPQPSVEQFENNLFSALDHLEPGKPVWIEDESRSIGRVYITDHIWNQIRDASLYEIHIPHETRVQHIAEEYGQIPTDTLSETFTRLQKKLGGQHVKTALEALAVGDLPRAVEVALVYYDKTYRHLMELRDEKKIQRFYFEDFDPVKMAQTLLQKV